MPTATQTPDSPVAKTNPVYPNSNQADSPVPSRAQKMLTPILVIAFRLIKNPRDFSNAD